MSTTVANPIPEGAMILADVFKYVFLVLGVLVVIVSYWLATTALFPAAVERARVAYGARPMRLIATGALATIPLVLLGLVLLNAAPNAALKLAGAVSVALPLVLGLAGSAGLSERVGRGLVHAEDARTPWRRSLRGGSVLALTFLLPIVGWFVVLPMVLMSGCGAVLLAMRHRPESSPLELASAA